MKKSLIEHQKDFKYNNINIYNIYPNVKKFDYINNCCEIEYKGTKDKKCIIELYKKNSLAMDDSLGEILYCFDKEQPKYDIYYCFNSNIFYIEFGIIFKDLNVLNFLKKLKNDLLIDLNIINILMDDKKVVDYKKFTFKDLKNWFSYINTNFTYSSCYNKTINQFLIYKKTEIKDFTTLDQKEIILENENEFFLNFLITNDTIIEKKKINNEIITIKKDDYNKELFINNEIIKLVFQFKGISFAKDVIKEHLILIKLILKEKLPCDNKI